MLRQAYAANLIVSAIAYAALFAWAPSLPQLLNSVERGIHAAAQGHTLIGPLFYRAFAIRG